MKSVFALALLAATASAGYVKGVDCAYAYPQESWDCLKSKGYDFAVIRCYRSVGKPDDACAESVLKARKAGMSPIDLYFFPDRDTDAAEQMKTFKAHVDEKNITFDHMWLDIEMKDPYWFDSTSENRAFFTTLANTATTLFGDQLGGVYTNQNGWTEIMGDWSGGSQFGLWWPHWDSYGESWDNFSPFCGWTKDTLVYKQFTGSHPTCDMDIDQDSYPA